MKFGHRLQFNAVAEWWADYIAYASLKKQINTLERRQRGANPRLPDLEAGEGSSLMGRHEGYSTDDDFKLLLDKELSKITKFYEAQEKELLDRMNDLIAQILRKETQCRNARDSDHDGDEGDDYQPLTVEVPFATTTTSFGPPRRRMSGYFPKPPRPQEPQRREPLLSDRRNIMPYSGEGDMEASIEPMDEHSIDAPENALIAASPVSPTSSPSLFARVSNVRVRRPSLSQIFKAIVSDESVWAAKMTSLAAYVELNYSGFKKILKKYDKVTYSDLKDPYLQNVVEKAYPFLPSTRERMQENMGNLVQLYAKCFTRGDTSMAYEQLRVYQREYAAWERDTGWRQMMRIGRRGESEGQAEFMDDSNYEGPTQEVQSSNFYVWTPLGPLKFQKKKLFFPIAVMVLIALLRNKVVSGVEANNCLAILVFATLLWATEVIPLFVTSLFVPLLLVLFRTIRSSDGTGNRRLTTPEATKFMFSVMFSPTIMILIGGFTIASALSKTNIDRVIITRVLSLAGKQPSTVLLAFMCVSCFASMWISNVAAPALCFTLIQPILRNLPPKSAFGPCLIMGIALAANIGGQISPISSPQNLIALEYMDPQIDWLNWFAVAIPVSSISIFLIWLLLLMSYRPGMTSEGEKLEIKPIRPTGEKFTLKQWWVTFVCIVTIGLWCVEHEIEAQVGDMGIIAILPIVAFFSTGVLKKADFEQFMWTIVFLAMGGIALGKAVDSSGLLQVLDNAIRHIIQGLSLYSVVLVMSCIVLVVSTFISHTIASVLLVPIAAQIGGQLQDPHPRLLIFLTGLLCSIGMGMPVSGFPNQTAATQVNELGAPYLTNVDFLKNGIPASIIAALVVATVGFLLMRAIGL